MRKLDNPKTITLVKKVRTLPSHKLHPVRTLPSHKLHPVSNQVHPVRREHASLLPYYNVYNIIIMSYFLLLQMCYVNFVLVLVVKVTSRLVFWVFCFFLFSLQRISFS